MRTTISIPEAIFRQAERLARRLKKSRSRLYAEAVAEYVRHRDPDEVTRAINGARASLNPDRGEFVAESARRTLRRLSW